MTRAARTLVFGAFDRHNLGDMLFAHVVAALAPRRERLVFAGVAECDLRRWGGHFVRAIADIAAADGDELTDVIHAGGELLTCDTWQAAVMTRAPEEAAHAIRRFESRPAERLGWGRQTLGIAHDIAYLLPRHALRRPGRFVLNAVGGIALDSLAQPLRDEALARLREADAVTVRDRLTQATLARHGIAVELAPDCAVLVAELFGAAIRARGAQGEVAEIAARFPRGYLAVQFAAELGDDATLAALATALDDIAAENGFGIVLFRAGAAPWHDDLEPYRRLAGRLRAPAVVAEALHIFDICALIARSRGFFGTSLHGRIVALAFGVPRASLVADTAVLSKAGAFIATWEPEAPPVIAPDAVARGLRLALAEDRAAALGTSQALAARCRRGLERLLAL